MEIVDVIKEWAGVGVAVCAAIYGVVKYIHDFRNGREAVKQNEQHTEQEKLTTDERLLDLDSRRVKASEEVASEALEDMAEARRENLKLLESDYEKSKAIIELQSEMKILRAKVDKIEEEKYIACFFFCRKAYECSEKDPVFGPYQFDVTTLETLKKLIAKYENEPKRN